MDLSRSSTNHHEICIQGWCGFTAENLLSKIFLPETLKIWRVKPKIIEDRRQSKARNFETAQPIDKQISDVSSTKRY